MPVAPRRLLAPMAALVTAAGLWWWLFPSDTRLVRQASHELAALASVPAGETDLARAARAARLGPYLADRLVVDVAERPDLAATKEQVLSFVARFLTSPGGIAVTLDEVDVEVDGTRATARAVATARESDLRGGPDLIEMREVLLEFEKVDGRWLLVHGTLGAPSGESGSG